MKTTRNIIAAAFFCLTLVGCATNRSALDLSLPASTPAAQQNGKTVYINTALDKRIFQTAPSSPDIPSLDPSEDQNDKIKLRALGRKRNSYGKALGDILLTEGNTVETMTSASISQAFSESGYRVITNKNEVSSETVIVDANINKFWAWMNPGFWAIALSSEISTDLTLKTPANQQIKKVSVKASDNFQMATESNWVEVINKALQLYIDDLKSKLRQ